MWGGSCYQAKFYRGGLLWSSNPHAFLYHFWQVVTPSYMCTFQRKLFLCYLPIVGTFSCIPFLCLFCRQSLFGKATLNSKTTVFPNPFLYFKWSLKFLPFTIPELNLEVLSAFGSSLLIKLIIGISGLFPPPMGMSLWQSTNWQIYTETCQGDTWESLTPVTMVKFVNFRLFWTCACERQVVKPHLPLCWGWWVKHLMSCQTIFCCCHQNMLSWHISQVLWLISMEYR